MTLAQLAPELVVLAVTLEDRAGRIESLADGLSARVTAATWQGPAADRFRLTADERRQQLRAAADRLRGAAQQTRLLASMAVA